MPPAVERRLAFEAVVAVAIVGTAVAATFGAARVEGSREKQSPVPVAAASAAEGAATRATGVG